MYLILALGDMLGGISASCGIAVVMPVMVFCDTGSNGLLRPHLTPNNRHLVHQASMIYKLLRHDGPPKGR